MAGYTDFFWQDIEIRVDPDPFFPSSQISAINKNPRSNTPLNTKKPFKWVFVDIIPAISSKILTKYTNFSNYLLIMDDYSKIPKVYIMENITTEEVIDKLDMFQERSENLHEFGWWDRDIIQTDADTQFTSKEFH